MDRTVRRSPARLPFARRSPVRLRLVAAGVVLAALALLAGTAVALDPAPSAASPAGSGAADAVTVGALSPLTVETAAGPLRFSVEVVATAEERARGLMHRRQMDADRGMLFDMGRTAPAFFWMRNTYLSLDILFLAPDGEIRRIAANTEPLSEAQIPSGEPVRYVLELVAGTAAARGIKVGDRVVHPVIRGR